MMHFALFCLRNGKETQMFSVKFIKITLTFLTVLLYTKHTLVFYTVYIQFAPTFRRTIGTNEHHEVYIQHKRRSSYYPL